AGRLRYSVAHEIAHTLFPDCHEQVRNRSRIHSAQGDNWQLETLCNIGAAEILMPLGSMRQDETTNLQIDLISKMRKDFDVSTEAILIRLAHLSEKPCAIFVASRPGEPFTGNPSYVFDYMIPSRTWKYSLNRAVKLAHSTPVAECTA